MKNMVARVNKRYLLLVLLILTCLTGIAQTVPGINYQAVARDNFGKELINREIDVMFSIISGNPLGEVVYRELHAKVRTTSYGVFSLVIGKGEPLNGGKAASFPEINWETANHYLKVEVKFSSNFIDMGTMQFFAVPYALYARKSLEPGPQGPKGDPGNPATDDQTLSFNGNNLSISGGNTVNLSTLNIPHQLSLFGDTLSIMGGNKIGLQNQIQDLQFDVNNKLKISKNSSATEIDLTPFKQNLTYNSSTGFLSISNGTGVDFSSLKNDEIQDIKLTGNQLTIDKNAASAGVDLSKYLDNKDEQTLSYNPENYQLAISNGGSISIGSLIAFRAGIATSLNIPNNSPVDLIFDQVTGNYYNDGGNYNPASGVFQAPYNGIYSFSISINLPTGISSVIIKLTGSPYETIIGPTTASGFFRGSIVMKLNKNDIVNIAVLQNNGFPINPYIISGSFSGFRVY
jgi:hypothetical protein